MGLGVSISDSIFFSEEKYLKNLNFPDLVGDSCILCHIFRNFNGLSFIIIVNSINFYLVLTDSSIFNLYEYMQDIIENKILKGMKKTI